MEKSNSGKESLSYSITEWKRFILDLKEVKTLLGYKDLRSAIRWCEENNVFILSQGNTQFVNSVEFMLKFYHPFIEHLKHSGENWRTQVMCYLFGDIHGLLEDTPAPPDTYRPTSEFEISFLQKLNRL